MQPGLQRQLGLVSAISLVVGQVIGVGIFLVPADMARSVGSPFWLLLIWLTMAVLSFCGALCYAELALRFPEAGGGYVYLREGYGRLVAFLYGWKSLFVLDPGLAAVWGMGAANYAGVIVPTLSPLAKQLAAIGAILLLAGINILGVRLGDRVLRAITLLKLSMLGFLIVWAFGRGLGDWTNFVPLIERHSGPSSLREALSGGFVLAFFAYAGWWDMTKAAGEIREPERTIPRALLLSLFLVTIVYILVSGAFLYLVPLEQVADNKAFAGQVGQALFGSAGSAVFAGVVIVCVLGSLVCYLLAAPRVYFAMARDGLFFPILARVHPRLGTPIWAIAAQAGLACLLVVVGTFDQVLNYVVFVTVLFLGLTAATLFRFHRRLEQPTPLRIGYPITPLLFLIMVVVLLFLLGLGNPIEASIGVGVVLLGVPIYWLFFHKRGSKPW